MNIGTDEVSREIFAMDTVMSLKVYGNGAADAADEAVAEIYRLDKLLSTGSDDSEVSLLNGTGEAVLSEDGVALMKDALALYRETDGIFDVSIYPVMEAWGFPDKDYHVPDKDALSEALKKVDASSVTFDDISGSVKFEKAGMKIDFGGIGKGYTSSGLVRILKKCGIKSALVNLGGNVQALGTKPDGSMWKIGIQDPEDSSGMLGVLQIADKCVITSGGYERYFEEDGRTYHHIIDPRTGYPAESGLISVSIAGDDGTFADGLSTSLYIMGEDAAVAFWRSGIRDFEMILETDDHRILVTEGIAQDFSSERSFDVIPRDAED